jgi:hypothetical protein
VNLSTLSCQTSSAAYPRSCLTRLRVSQNLSIPSETRPHSHFVFQNLGTGPDQIILQDSIFAYGHKHLDGQHRSESRNTLHLAGEIKHCESRQAGTALLPLVRISLLSNLDLDISFADLSNGKPVPVRTDFPITSPNETRLYDLLDAKPA